MSSEPDRRRAQTREAEAGAAAGLVDEGGVTYRAEDGLHRVFHRQHEARRQLLQLAAGVHQRGRVREEVERRHELVEVARHPATPASSAPTRTGGGDVLGDADEHVRGLLDRLAVVVLASGSAAAAPSASSGRASRRWRASTSSCLRVSAMGLPLPQKRTAPEEPVTSPGVREHKMFALGYRRTAHLVRQRDNDERPAASPCARNGAPGTARTTIGRTGHGARQEAPGRTQRRAGAVRARR